MQITSVAGTAPRKVRLHHRSRGWDDAAEHVTHPYGLFWGKRSYVIAFSERTGDVRPYLWRIGKSRRGACRIWDLPFLTRPSIRIWPSHWGVFRSLDLISERHW